MASFCIRKAERVDVPAMHRIRTSVQENRLSEPHRISEASYIPYIDARTAWVAESNGALAGFAVLDASTRTLWAMFIHPEAQGQGIGTALHQALIAEAKLRQINELRLSTGPGTRASRFYAKAGWKSEGFSPEGEQIFRLALADASPPPHASVEQLWSRFRRTNPNAPAEPRPAFYFCDNPEDADLCAALVVAGRKRATATSLAELELSGAPAPCSGDYAVVTNWAGEAKAIIRTVSVEIKRFGEVDEAFAVAEGEGDRTLAWWRNAHRAYYQRVLSGSRYEVDDDLEIACEVFELVMSA